MLSRFKNIISVALLCLFCGCNTSSDKQQKQVVNNITEVAFEKSVHAFGKIKLGETVGCYFSFTNTGKYPLIINKVKPGCGCTTVNYPKQPILPGNNGEIEVRFNSKGFSGRQYKVIQVHTNIEGKMKELVISANVIN